MALTFAPEPSNGSALIRDGLNRLAASTQRPNAIASVAEIGSLNIGRSYAVYDLQAADVAAGGGLEKARATGFHYLVGAAEAPVASAEVRLDPSGAASLVSTINYGRYVQAAAAALAQLATHAQVIAGSYEARLLRSSAIYLMAIWLRSSSGTADLIFPLAPAPTGVQAQYLYPAADFMALITPLAKGRTTQKPAGLVP
jgi:hypothetical protein